MADNPCSFKGACKKCNFVTQVDRPDMCLSIACPEYTPCKDCKNNRALNDAGLCVYCDKSTTPAKQNAAKVKESAPATTRRMEVESSPVEAEGGISFPGTAPERYGKQEKEYYDRLWDAYAGFYQDPTAFALLHNIILIEIELMHTATLMSQRRHEGNRELENRQERLAKNMKILRDQLPAKEAMQLNEDEKSLGAIHEAYLAEKALSYVGGVARVLSQDAIALAPHLHFPVSPINLLTRLGYKTVEVVAACEKYFTPDEVPKEPEQMLEFLGYFLKAKYAMADKNDFSNEIVKYDDEVEDAAVIAEQVKEIFRKSEEDKLPKQRNRDDDPPEPGKPFAISY